MVNELVKFSNQFNAVALRRFDAVHLDVLMAIASRVREQGTAKVVFSFAELRRLMRLRRNMTTEEFIDTVVGVNERLLATNSMLRDGSRIIQFALFTTFETDRDAQTLTVSVNERFAFLLNDLTAQFTRFELAEFAGLRSRYAKEFYRRAKQFRSTGVWRIGREDFCRLLDVPKSTADVPRDLNRRVLRPIVEEVGPLIHLEVERLYERRPGQRGRAALSGFVFRFDKERDEPVRVDGGSAVDPMEGRWYELPEGRVYWCGKEFEKGWAVAHLQGDVNATQCPVCLYDAQNLPLHGRTAPEAPKYPDRRERPSERPYVAHFAGSPDYDPRKAGIPAPDDDLESVRRQAQRSLRAAGSGPLFIDPMTGKEQS